jgi:hypothetical protein
MRGGLKLADRGVIPRLLSGVFRRGKKISKDSDGETTVDVALSYYEIYNDKVFDLLEPPEKRTPAGLPLREKDGKTIVVGLSERCCEDLRDFERLYIEANNNRVTAATKLNAHSSRSHAILRVKVTQTTGDMVLESTASAIDLAGSEDNRRTDNGKERLVESAAINKSLFVLSQCIDAISRGDKRIPYRESKMTRILSLGQNNGITIMILNLAPLRSYHLDTLSSLNVSSRAKRIEVREIENEVVFKHQPPRTASMSSTGSAPIQRQPLRPLANAHNVTSGAALAAARAGTDKPVKAFAVYPDRIVKPAISTVQQSWRPTTVSLSSKRPSDPCIDPRPSKLAKPSLQPLVRPAAVATQPSISAAQIEAMVERKVSEILASRAAAAQPAPAVPQTQASGHLGEEVQRRLDALERRINEDADGDGSGRSEGLRLLLQARHAKERGDDEAALRLYEKAMPFFPGQARLLAKVERLRTKIAATADHKTQPLAPQPQSAEPRPRKRSSNLADDGDASDPSYHDADDADADDSFVCRPRKPRNKPTASKKTAAATHGIFAHIGPATPRTKMLLDIVNSRDLGRIRTLHGFGAKKAQDLVDYLGLDDTKTPVDEATSFDMLSSRRLESLAQLRLVPGMGGRTVERAYEGLAMV